MIRANKILNQSESVNGSSINKIDDFKPIAGVMNVAGVIKYIFEYSMTLLRSYVTDKPPIPRSAF